MLIPRIIPCLLVRNKGLVKTIQFKNEKYVGDPLNAVRIFNEKECDELMVLDIDATVQDRKPDYKLIENLAAQCHMPLCYGGGIKTVEQAKKILGFGVEKVSLSSALVENPSLVTEIAWQIGNQSVVGVLDVKKQNSGTYELMTHNGTRKTGKNLLEFAAELEKRGIGEIVVNSIDNDGEMKGYDLALIDNVRQAVSVPLTVLGGAGNYADIKKLFCLHKIIGVAAGSLFVFKGRYRAVLINYPTAAEKADLLDL